MKRQPLRSMPRGGVVGGGGGLGDSTYGFQSFRRGSIVLSGAPNTSLLRNKGSMSIRGIGGGWSSSNTSVASSRRYRSGRRRGGGSTVGGSGGSVASSRRSNHYLDDDTIQMLKWIKERIQMLLDDYVPSCWENDQHKQPLVQFVTNSWIQVLFVGVVVTKTVVEAPSSSQQQSKEENHNSNNATSTTKKQTTQTQYKLVMSHNELPNGIDRMKEIAYFVRPSSNFVADGSSNNTNKTLSTSSTSLLLTSKTIEQYIQYGSFLTNQSPTSVMYMIQHVLYPHVVSSSSNKQRKWSDQVRRDYNEHYHRLMASLVECKATIASASDSSRKETVLYIPQELPSSLDISSSSSSPMLRALWGNSNTDDDENTDTSSKNVEERLSIYRTLEFLVEHWKKQIEGFLQHSISSNTATNENATLSASSFTTTATTTTTNTILSNATLSAPAAGLVIGSNKSSSGGGGILEEIQFWKQRLDDFEHLTSQLESSRVKTVFEILELQHRHPSSSLSSVMTTTTTASTISMNNTNSSDHDIIPTRGTAFTTSSGGKKTATTKISSYQSSNHIEDAKRVFGQIKASMMEAKMNVKYLTLLKGPCYQLSKSPIQSLKPIMCKLFNTARVITSLSTYYNQNEQFIGLIRELSHEVIQRCRNEISLTKLFEGAGARCDDRHDDYVGQISKSLFDIIQCCMAFQKLYVQVAHTVRRYGNNEDDDESYDIDDGANGGQIIDGNNKNNENHQTSESNILSNVTQSTEEEVEIENEETRSTTMTKNPNKNKENDNNKDQQQVIWSLESSSTMDLIFAPINEFVQRCYDVQQICESFAQFDQDFIGSVATNNNMMDDEGSEALVQQLQHNAVHHLRACNAEETFLGIQHMFFQHYVSNLKRLPYDILNVYDKLSLSSWQSDFHKFKTGIQELTIMYKNSIKRAFQSVDNLTTAMDCIDYFRTRCSIQQDLKDCLKEEAPYQIERLFQKLCREVKQTFDEYLQSNKRTNNTTSMTATTTSRRETGSNTSQTKQQSSLLLTSSFSGSSSSSGSSSTMQLQYAGPAQWCTSMITYVEHNWNLLLKSLGTINIYDVSEETTQSKQSIILSLNGFRQQCYTNWIAMLQLKKRSGNGSNHNKGGRTSSNHATSVNSSSTYSPSADDINNNNKFDLNKALSGALLAREPSISSSTSQPPNNENAATKRGRRLICNFPFELIELHKEASAWERISSSEGFESSSSSDNNNAIVDEVLSMLTATTTKNGESSTSSSSGGGGGGGIQLLEALEQTRHYVLVGARAYNDVIDLLVQDEANGKDDDNFNIFHDHLSRLDKKILPALNKRLHWKTPKRIITRFMDDFLNEAQELETTIKTFLVRKNKLLQLSNEFHRHMFLVSIKEDIPYEHLTFYDEQCSRNETTLNLIQSLSNQMNQIFDLIYKDTIEGRSQGVLMEWDHFLTKFNTIIGDYLFQNVISSLKTLIIALNGSGGSGEDEDGPSVRHNKSAVSSSSSSSSVEGGARASSRPTSIVSTTTTSTSRILFVVKVIIRNNVIDYNPSMIQIHEAMNAIAKDIVSLTKQVQFFDAKDYYNNSTKTLEEEGSTVDSTTTIDNEDEAKENEQQDNKKNQLKEEPSQQRSDATTLRKAKAEPSTPPTTKNDTHYDTISKSTQVLELVAKVMNSTAQTSTRAIIEKDQWEQFKGLWDTDKDSFIRRYAKSNHSVTVFETDLDKRSIEQQTISLIESSWTYHFLSVDHTSLKNFLLKESKTWECKLLKLLHKKWSSDMSEAHTKIQNDLSKLVGPISTIDSLGQAMECQTYWMEEQGVLFQKKVKDLVAGHKLMLKHDEAVSESEELSMKALEQDWKQLNDHLEQNVQDIIEDGKVIVKQHLDRDVDLFVKDVTKIFSDFSQDIPPTDPTNEQTMIQPQQMLIKIQTYKENGMKLQSREKTLQKGYVLFGIDLNNDADLQDFLDLTLHAKDIWNTVIEWNNLQREWKSQLLNSVDLQSMSTTIVDLYKQVTGWKRKMGKWEVWNYLDTSLQRFFKFHTLLTLLRTSGLKEDHWMRIGEEVGSKQITKWDDPSVLTFCDILQGDLLSHFEFIKAIADRSKEECLLETNLDQIQRKWQTLRIEIITTTSDATTISVLDGSLCTTASLQLPSYERLLKMIEEDQTCLQEMKLTPFAKNVFDDIETMEGFLESARDTLDRILNVQQKWHHMQEGKFAITEHKSTYQDISHQFSNLIEKLSATPLISHWSSKEMQDLLDSLDGQLDSIKEE